MKRIYTRTGDKGTTGIHGGTRVPKDDIRIEANGCLDELNCQIGVIRSMRCPVKPGMTDGTPDVTEKAELRVGFRDASIFSASGTKTQSSGVADDERDENRNARTAEDWDEILHEVQRNLMSIMSLVATPAAEREKNPNTLPEDIVAQCETSIDTLTEECGPGLHFLLPGGTPLAARLQLARAVCRRAERRLWTLHRQDPLHSTILQYINRLSDLLFVMARCELASQQWPEERWQAFAYKNQK